MNRQIMRETGERGSQSGNQSGSQREKAAIGIGETLPLFELPQMKKRTRQQSSHQLVASGRAPFSGHSVSGHSVKPGGKRSGRVRNPRAVSDGDRHMHVAWQLSKALKAVKTGRKTGREMAKLTANQRHQVGNAICEHLLASLRQQVHSESTAEYGHIRARPASI